MVQQIFTTLTIDSRTNLNFFTNGIANIYRLLINDSRNIFDQILYTQPLLNYYKQPPKKYSNILHFI